MPDLRPNSGAWADRVTANSRIQHTKNRQVVRAERFDSTLIRSCACLLLRSTLVLRDVYTTDASTSQVRGEAAPLTGTSAIDCVWLDTNAAKECLDILSANFGCLVPHLVSSIG